MFHGALLVIWLPWREIHRLNDRIQGLERRIWSHGAELAQFNENWRLSIVLVEKEAEKTLRVLRDERRQLINVILDEKRRRAHSSV
jgi:hypothetical protein